MLWARIMVCEGTLVWDFLIWPHWVWEGFSLGFTHCTWPTTGCTDNEFSQWIFTV